VIQVGAPDLLQVVELRALQVLKMKAGALETQLPASRQELEDVHLAFGD
jgi:hypothetical protein